MQDDRTENYYIETFNKYLEKATKAIAESYFELPVDGSDDPIYRERVYCYELYHQLRKTFKDYNWYKLYGEVDKTGHPLLPGDYKPDFIIHNPGDMDTNLAIIEVKPIIATRAEMEKDLIKLEFFLEKGNYYAGILLVYAWNQDSYKKILNLMDSRKEKNRKIHIFLHIGYKKEIYSSNFLIKPPK